MLSNSTLSQRQSDRYIGFIFKTLGIFSGLISFLILLFIFIEAIPALKFSGVASFFTDSAWYPKENLFNILPMLWASILTAVGGIFLAAPLGILIALFSSYYAPKPIAWIYTRLIELLSGIPSVVFGFWGLVVLVPWITAFHPPGASLLAGILIVALMILPTMALAADSVFKSFPQQQLQGASALGISRLGTITKLVLPATGRALFSALILQTGRALGETMAILMVAGNVVQNPSSLFDPVRTLTANMALEIAYASGNHRSALFVSALMLMILVTALMSLSEYFERGFREN